MEKNISWSLLHSTHKNQFQADFRSTCERWNNKILRRGYLLLLEVGKTFKNLHESTNQKFKNWYIGLY